MALRFGEMVLIIRTQDFASRNLDRVSANLGKLSKFQELNRRKSTLDLRQSRLLSRMDTTRQELRGLQQKLNLEHELSRVISDRELASKRLAGLQAASAGSGTLRGAGGRFTSAAPQLASASQLLSGLKSREADLLKQHESLLKSLAATSPTLAKMGTAQATAHVNKLTNSLGLMGQELRIVQSDIAHVDDALNRVRWEKVHRAGQTVSRLGRVMQLTGLIAAGSFVAAGNAAANFGQSVTLAATQTRDLNAPLSQVAERSTKLQDAILSQMQKFPGSAESMSNAAYEIFSSLDLADKGRIKFWRGLQILEKANKVAVAGGIDLDDAIKGLIITLNNFDPDLNNVNETLDTMFDIVRFGNIRVSDFTQLITRVAATAKGVGHTLEDLAAPIAMLTRVLPSERVGTGLFRLEEVFANRDFQQGFKLISKARVGEGLDFRKAGGGLIPFQQILEDIVKVFPELEDGRMDVAEFLKMVSSAGKTARTGKPSEGQLFTSQARNVLRPLVQDMDQVREIQGLIAGNQNEFNRAFEAMARTPAVQWKIFLNQMKAVALEIGRDALPALLYLAGGIQRLIEWFRNLDPQLKSNIIKIGVFASVATLIGGILLSVVGGLVSLVGAIALVSGGLGTAGGAGLLGRMALLLTLLRTLSLIGVVTITIKLLMDKTGPSDFVEGAMDKLEKFSDKPGMRGLHGVISTLNAIDEALGLAEEEPKKGLFNPNFKLNIPTKELKAFEKQYKRAREGPSIQEVLAGAKKETLKTVADELGMSLDEIRKQFGATGEEAGGMGDAISQAAQQAEQSIDQAASNMTNIWNQFRDENVRTFGELFSGPFFQSETWSLAKEWDVKPTMAEINKDLRMQIQNFRKYRNTLNAISQRKGVSAELMAELRQLGPDALDKLEVLRKAAPKQFNAFVTLWRTKQVEIERATKIDFNKQLKQWFSYGKNIAKNIILGLQSSDVELDAAFKRYITTKFPGIVEEAKKQARAEFNRQSAGGQASGGNKTGTTTTKVNSDNNTVTITITPKKGESSKEAARRAAWEFSRSKGSARDRD